MAGRHPDGGRRPKPVWTRVYSLDSRRSSYPSCCACEHGDHCPAHRVRRKLFTSAEDQRANPPAQVTCCCKSAPTAISGSEGESFRQVLLLSLERRPRCDAGQDVQCRNEGTRPGCTGRSQPTAHPNRVHSGLLPGSRSASDELSAPSGNLGMRQDTLVHGHQLREIFKNGTGDVIEHTFHKRLRDLKELDVRH